MNNEKNAAVVLKPACSYDKLLVKAYCKEKDKMIIGYLSKKSGPDWEWSIVSRFSSSIIDPLTICRYSGIMDYKGKKLFEHDLVLVGFFEPPLFKKCYIKYKAEIVFYLGAFCLQDVEDKRKIPDPIANFGAIDLDEYGAVRIKFLNRNRYEKGMYYPKEYREMLNKNRKKC